MTTATRPDRAAAPAYAGDARPNDAPILVASDGTDFSRPALEAALALSAGTGTPVRLVAVSRDLPVIPVEFGIVLAPPEQVAVVRDALLLRVKEQVVEVAGPAAEWPIDVRWGDVALEIAQAAADTGARLIVLGVEHRNVAARVFAHETALALLRLSRVPLFVVPRGFTSNPRRVTVATDFSHVSIAATRLALELFPSIATIDLVHVWPTSVPALGVAEWFAPLEATIELGFELARKELESIRPVDVSCVTLRGKPSREITSFAQASGSELLVVGSRGAGLLERLLVGSTSRPVIRSAPCAALAVHPSSERDGPFALLDPHRYPIQPDDWGTQLARFSNLNTGRLATIEVLGADIGSQVQDRDVRFLGASWDPHDQRLEIMTGMLDDTTRHHTRNIANVRAVDVLKDAFGRDWILRVSDGETQTLLTLSRHKP
jgi:nucleotide-binding universal stress UspA family protein